MWLQFSTVSSFYSRQYNTTYARNTYLSVSPCVAALRRQQDAGLFKPSPYAGYPFLMIPDLSNLGNPYLATSSARTVIYTFIMGQLVSLRHT